MLYKLLSTTEIVGLFVCVCVLGFLQGHTYQQDEHGLGSQQIQAKPEHQHFSPVWPWAS